MKDVNVHSDSFEFRDLFKPHVLLAFLFLVIPMVPYANYVLKGMKTTWLIYAIWLVMALSSYKNIHLLLIRSIIQRKAEFFCLGLFTVVVLLSYIFVETNEKSFSYVVSFITMQLILIMDCYYAIVPPKYRKAILFLCITALGIQAAVSLPYLLSADGFLAREYADGNTRALMSEAEMTNMLSHGIGNNGLYSAAASVAIGAYALAEKLKAIYRYLLYAAAVSLIFSMVASTFFAPLLLMCLGIGMVLVSLKARLFRPRMIFTIILGAVLIFVFYANYLQGTDLMKPVENKIEGFSKQFGEKGLSADADVTGRAKLTEASINSFANNPLFGIGVPPWGDYKLVGGHVCWIDYLANFGILGCAPFFAFILLLFIKNRKRYFSQQPFTQGNSILYNKAMFAGFVIFLLANFISPMVTVHTAYTTFLFWFTSVDVRYKQ